MANGAATDDPQAGWSTGYPGPEVRHTTTGAPGPYDPAAGFVTGYPGDRTARHTGGDAQGLDTTDDDAPGDDRPEPASRGHPPASRPLTAQRPGR